MDTTQTITHISLCAGYGGIDIGLKRAIPNLRTVAFSEIEGYACANLVAKMEARLLDAAPIWTDLKTFPWGAFRDRVGILSGGYPCQPFSSAGQRQGKDDPRHLWPYIANGIRLLRPRLCFFENVEGHISLGLSDVIEDLAGMGYRTTWGIFSAAEVGAPHQRKRVFILAHRNDSGLQGRLCGRTHQEWKDINGYAGCGGAVGGIWPSRPSEPQHEWEPPRVVANTDNNGRSAPRRNAGTMGDPQCAEESGESEFGAVAQTADGSGPVVGNAKSGMPRESGAGDRGESVRGASEAGQLGDTDCGRQSSRIDTGSGSETIGRGEGNIEQDESRQAEPSLGGDADGSASGLDDAKLYVTCDNRTDELRLLGNGVVPAVATQAFLILSAQLSTP
jgi:DNA (cytosine-5)-methyltransferase 1